MFYKYRNTFYKDEYNNEGVFQGTKYYSNVGILLNDETKFNEDLNNDDQIGDTIKSVKYDGSSNNDNFSIYETSSGAYIFDNSMLDENSNTLSPVILTNTVRGSIYEYKNDNDFLGAVSNEDGSSIYYQDHRGRWYKDNFDQNGNFLKLKDIILI